MRERRRFGHVPLRSTGVQGARCMWRALCMAWCLWCVVPLAQAVACEGARHVHLTRSVEFSPEDLAGFRAMAPLRVASLDAPPMVYYDEKKGAYAGIGIDAWCFIVGRLGLRYEFVPAQGLTVAQRIAQVQQGAVDVFMPLSLERGRAQHGLFTRPYYESYYAVIASRSRRLVMHDMADLEHYRVGVVRGVALESVLEGVVPPQQLVRFDQGSSAGMFEALRDGSIDAAVFNKSIFEEKRYLHEYFDLENIFTLYGYPRSYRFYFSASPQHERVVAAFDRYLAAMNLSESTTAHEGGERQFIERYVEQRGHHLFLQMASVAAVVLALVLYLSLGKYRRLVRRLEDGERRIRQQQQALQAAN